MNAEEYLFNVVMPLHSAFCKENNLANFFASLTTTYHMVDYVANDVRPEVDVGNAHIKIVRDEIIRMCPEFHAVYCVALAQKHVEVQNKNAERGLTVADIRRPKSTFLTVNGQALTVNGQLLTVTTGFKAMIGGKNVILGDAMEASVKLFAESLKQVCSAADSKLKENGR